MRISVIFMPITILRQRRIVTKKKKKKSPVSIFIVSDHARPKHAADAGEEAHTQFWPRFFDNDVAICVKQVIRVMSKNSFGIGLHPS